MSCSLDVQDPLESLGLELVLSIHIGIGWLGQVPDLFHDDYPAFLQCCTGFILPVCANTTALLGSTF